MLYILSHACLLIQNSLKRESGLCSDTSYFLTLPLKPNSLTLCKHFYWDVGVSTPDGPYIEIRLPQRTLNLVVNKFKLNGSQNCYYLVRPL